MSTRGCRSLSLSLSPPLFETSFVRGYKNHYRSLQLIKSPMEEGGEDGAAFLQQLNCILSSDILIDEVGFVHPTQLESLQEACTPSAMEYEANTSALWCADHKLAISIQALAPLFKAAKHAFIAARAEYESLLSHVSSLSECKSGHDDVQLAAQKLLSCTRAVVVLNSGYKTAWDVRKEIFKNLSMIVPIEELQLSSMALSYNPKCEEAWAHRRWTIRSKVESKFSGQIPEHLLQGESKLIAAIADRSRMNYRAWHHCCWLVSWMTTLQVLHELQRWKEWAQLHVADNSCFHFRRCLFQRLLIEDKLLEMKDAWLDEIEWNKSLINLYIGREALWIHRRFLFFIGLHYLVEMDGSCYPKHVVPTEKREWDLHFVESEIGFVNACIASCTEDNSEEGQKQIIFGCTFKLWVFQQWKKSPTLCTTLAEWCKDAHEVKQLLQIKAPVQTRLWEDLFKSCFTHTDEGSSS